MESIIWLLILIGVGYVAWKFWPKADSNNDGKIDIKDSVTDIKTSVAETADVNKDGKVDAADAVEVVKKTTARAKKVADVNKDGKVDKADAKAVVEKVKKPRTKKA